MLHRIDFDHGSGACGPCLCHLILGPFKTTYEYLAPSTLGREVGQLFIFPGATVVVALVLVLLAGLPSLFPKELTHWDSGFVC